jgi:hypothetical protein
LRAVPRIAAQHSMRFRPERRVRLGSASDVSGRRHVARSLRIASMSERAYREATDRLTGAASHEAVSSSGTRAGSDTRARRHARRARFGCASAALRPGLLGLRQSARGAELLHRPRRAEARPRPARRGRQQGRVRVAPLSLQPRPRQATSAQARADDPRARHRRDRRRHDPRPPAGGDAPAALRGAPRGN